MKYTFIRHTGSIQPVPNGTIVIYRTHLKNAHHQSISKIHYPIKAENITWSFEPTIGRIYDYAIYRENDLGTNWLNSMKSIGVENK